MKDSTIGDRSSEASSTGISTQNSSRGSEPHDTSPSTPQNDRPLVEIGWVHVGQLNTEDRQALRMTRHQMLETLQGLFPGFRWRMSRVERRSAAIGAERRRLDELLDIAAEERDLHRWDVTFVITDSDLLTFHKPFALGAPSRAIGAAVLSTARILTDVDDSDIEEDVETKARRLTHLAMHLFGHLGRLDNTDDPTDFMFAFGEPADLDRMNHLDPELVPQLADHLAGVADVRLEETGRFHGRTIAFYIQATWLQRREIWSAIKRVEPWMFPLRFGRFTTAAASALVLLSVTAEAWELGLSQPPRRVAFLAVTAILALALLLLRRQRLLLEPRGGRLSEQRVAANVAVSLAMLIGLTLTYGMLFAASFASTEFLFSRQLITHWVPSLGGHLGTKQLATFAGFAAFLGLIVGALGASFEEQGYFRHITLVDEET